MARAGSMVNETVHVAGAQASDVERAVLGILEPRAELHWTPSGMGSYQFARTFRPQAVTVAAWVLSFALLGLGALLFLVKHTETFTVTVLGSHRGVTVSISGSMSPDVLASLRTGLERWSPWDVPHPFLSDSATAAGNGDGERGANGWAPDPSLASASLITAQLVPPLPPRAQADSAALAAVVALDEIVPTPSPPKHRVVARPEPIPALPKVSRIDDDDDDGHHDHLQHDQPTVSRSAIAVARATRDVAAHQAVDPAAHQPAHLVLDDGRTIDLDALVLIGRDPASPHHEPGVISLVAIDDPNFTVSKTHVGVGVDDDGIWVEDRFSTNGTSVLNLDVGSEPVPCPPGRRVHVEPGSVVLIGDRRATVVAARVTR